MKASTIEITVPQRTLGERIRAVRQFLRQMTQVELARQVGVSQNTMSQIESGEIPSPRAHVIKRLAEVLEVPSDYLLGVGEATATPIAPPPPKRRRTRVSV